MEVMSVPPFPTFVNSGVDRACNMVYIVGMDTRIRNVPKDVWREFKILCAEQDISMNRKIIELATKEVEERHKRKEK